MESKPPPTPPLPRKNEPGELGEAQAVFDTVIGPNLRLRDNLIQLVACVAGTFLGAIIGGIITRFDMMGLIIGGFCGLVGGLLISGAVLGVYRFIMGVQRK